MQLEDLQQANNTTWQQANNTTGLQQLPTLEQTLVIALKEWGLSLV